MVTSSDKVIKAALLVNQEGFDFGDDFIELNQKENINLQVLQKGEGRKNFLTKVKKLLLENKDAKEFTEDDIRTLEEEFDFVVNISESQSQGNALITGLNYAEIIFVKKELEDFSFDDYAAAVEEFKQRKRNFGK